MCSKSGFSFFTNFLKYSPISTQYFPDFQQCTKILREGYSRINHPWIRPWKRSTMFWFHPSIWKFVTTPLFHFQLCNPYKSKFPLTRHMTLEQRCFDVVCPLDNVKRKYDTSIFTKKTIRTFIKQPISFIVTISLIIFADCGDLSFSLGNNFALPRAYSI